MNRCLNYFHAITALLIVCVTCTLFFIPIFFLGLLKLLPINKLQVWCMAKVDMFAEYWIDINNAYLQRMPNLTFQIQDTTLLDPQRCYILVANHQSWADVLILSKVLNRRIPVPKFFVKDQLKWVPLLGFAWWAMGCTFVKRYSKTYLAKYPHKMGKDLQAAKKNIQALMRQPSTIMNFLEGTRFTLAKKVMQSSPYEYLLKPKSGGLQLAIQTMHQQLHSILDVSIAYDSPQHSIWDFLCRRIHTVRVHIREIPIPTEFITQGVALSESSQQAFHQWLNDQWQQKDKIIAQLRLGNIPS
ncbi:MAG: acetyltransferase [Legionellaceae bacterium]|nr:acetyltransferase [Legionellaceae bacterium]